MVTRQDIKPNGLMRLSWLTGPLCIALVVRGVSAQEPADPSLVVDGYSHDFGEIRDLAVDASGAIFVADRQRRSIAILAPDGTAIGVVGRGGDGPAEFRSITSVAVAGERVYAMDDARRRVLVFSTSGNFLTGWSWPGELGVPVQLIWAGV